MISRSSIRAKLLAHAAVVLIVPTLIYGLLVYRSAREVLQPAIEEQLSDEAVRVEEALSEFLSGQEQHVRGWAHMDIMRELVVRDVDKTISQFLEVARADYGYLDVLVMDNDGVCRASSSPAQIGRTFAAITGAGAVAGRIRGGERSGVAYSEDHRSFYIEFTAPVPDPDRDGYFLGTLVAMLDRSELAEVVGSGRRRANVELRLIDDRGRVLAGEPVEAGASELPRWPTVRARPAEHDEDNAVIYDGLDAAGTKYIVAEVALHRHPELPRLDWRVLAMVPRKLALGPVADLRDEVLMLGSLVTAIGLALAWLISSGISRPIKELTRITSRIADKGTLETIPDPTSRDEVGKLTLSFQKMVDNLASAQEELVQSAKLAFLGEMAAGIAHEIRTPLGIIKNSAQLIERRLAPAGDAEGVEFARFIYEETDRLNSFVTDVLNFSRPAPPQKGEADVNAIAARAVQVLKAEAATKNVILDTQLDADPATALCDSGQIYQVFLNIIMNAIQACEDGGRVEVATAAAGPDLEIVISDDGPGISEELRDNLFAPFSTKREGGIGLGLAIVKRIVTAHGGEIEADNRSEGGARFCLRLPRAGEV